MKTKYFAEAQIALATGKTLSDAYALDLILGLPFVGALSALPYEGGDGVSGLGELFGGTETSGYSRIPLSMASFTNPALTYATELAASGIQSSYNAQISFNPATGNWGEVVGLVIYYARVDTSGNLRVTPMYTSEFVAPVNVTVNKKLIIPNTSNARLRLIELIRKQLIQ